MKFPTDARDGVTYDLLSVLRMIVVQKLLPSKTGGRVALREYLVFDKDIRDRLLKIDPKDVAKEIGQIVKDKKQRLFDSATRAYESGLLDDDIYLLFKKEVSTEEI
jgi:defect-in-organelle-trafficking protein DotB